MAALIRFSRKRRFAQQRAGGAHNGIRKAAAIAEETLDRDLYQTAVDRTRATSETVGSNRCSSGDLVCFGVKWRTRHDSNV
jgi:hypothetical protein